MDHITLGSLICSDVATDPWLKLISDMSIKSILLLDVLDTLITVLAENALFNYSNKLAIFCFIIPYIVSYLKHSANALCYHIS